MKRLIVVMLALMGCGAVLPASAQSTYTTIVDGCGGKANQYCRVAARDQNEQPFDVIIDTRISPTVGNISTLSINYPFPGPQVLSVHGNYIGFDANPDGTKNAYYAAATFTSDDGSVEGTFQFYGYYVKSCSGRGCGGTIGWHFRILTGSVVTVQ